MGLLVNLGKERAVYLEEEGIKTIGELSRYEGNNKKVNSAKPREKYEKIVQLNLGVEKFQLSENIIKNVWWWLS